MLSAGAVSFVPGENFKAITYTGTGGSQSITGVGFQPDFVWIKNRNDTNGHILQDSTRGVGKTLFSHLNTAESGNSGDLITSFDTDGFTVNENFSGSTTNESTNKSGNTYVAWCWKANGGTTSSNTDGSITGTVQANTDAGFSIVQYNSSGNSSGTIGHGLGVKPGLVINKTRDSGSTVWVVNTDEIDGSNDYLILNTNAAKGDAYTAPTATTIGSIDYASNDKVISYCFASIDGFSNIDTYTGNGSANGPIVETGFEPAFLMIKRTSATDNWYIIDNARSTLNPRQAALFANLSDSEYATYAAKADFLSNGFQIVSTDGSTNASGDTYIYMAFAADPDEEAPTLASSFNIETYYGSGASGNNITGLGFQPNFLWTKSIAGSTNDFSHALMNSIRGASKSLNSNNNNAETTNANGLESFNSDGFSVGSGAGGWNYDNTEYVAWAWKANDDEPIIKGGPAKAVYKFESNANDVTGNHNGTASNVTYSSGKFNNAAVFNGSNAKINFSNGSFRFNELTISVWVKPAGSGHRTILENYDYQSGASKGFIFRIDQTTGKARFVIYNGDCTNPYPDDTSCSNVTAAVSTSAIATNAYTHIVVTMKLGELKMYINGELDVSTITQAIGYHSSASTNIGVANHAYAGGGESYYQGEIDQLRIYNGVASQLDVDALYAETASNNDDLTLGEPNSAIISANANAGFSIVKYNGNGGVDNNIPHGLSSTPEFVIIKNLNDAEDWQVFGGSVFDRAQLNSTDDDDGNFPLSYSATTITLPQGGQEANNAWNAAGDEYIMYCWHSVSGYSKIGTYEGNQTLNTDNVVNFGFKPDFVMIKNVDADGSQWMMLDTKRENGKAIYGNQDSAQSDYTTDILLTSQGLRFVSNNINVNRSGETYVYMAFAKNVPGNTTLANSFNAAFYAGSNDTDASTTQRTISGLGFRPDFLWIKRTDGSEAHFLQDSIRGSKATIYSHNTAGEYIEHRGVQNFNEDGYSVAGYNGVNKYREAFIAFGWKAGNTWESNYEGSIPSVINANTANGFSIISYRGTGASSQSVGHGLNSTPELVMIKKVSGTEGWIVWGPGFGTSNWLDLTSTANYDPDNAAWGGTHSSTVVNLQNSGAARSGADGQEYIAYVFHSVSNFSKIGTYSGSGSAVTINAGFAVDFVMIKKITGSGTGEWSMHNSLRGGDKALYANSSAAEDDNASNEITFTSTGFTVDVTGNNRLNNTGCNYLYMAFKKNATNNNTLANSFKVKTYTGNGSTQEITGIGFKPDLVWIKQRNDTNPHSFFDTTRGAGKMLVTSTNAAEINNVGDILGYFLDDGFQVNRNHGVHSAYDNSNHSSSTYVSWCWKAGNGWQSNYDGNVSSLTNANTGNGFSIVRYTANGNNNSTIGHGLGSTPKWIFIKKLDNTGDWIAYHSETGANKYLFLNRTDAATSVTNIWSSVGSSTFNLISGYNDYNQSGQEYIAYCWAEVSGYSKFGTYTGNGLSSGTIASTGFTPDFVLVKEATTTSDWGLFDSERSGTYYQKALFANENDAEMAEMNVNSVCEFLPVGHGEAANGGFRFRDSGSQFNVDGNDYIFIAFKMK